MKNHLPYYQWEDILSPVVKSVGPCKIYAMGLANKQQAISVFHQDICNSAGTFKETAGTPDSCFLLVLIASEGPRDIHVCRDKIEFLSDRCLSMTIIPWIMSYSKFIYLLKGGDYFARTVYNKAILCYNALPMNLPGCEDAIDMKEEAITEHSSLSILVQKQADAFAERACSLMAGVELYFKRKEHALAALLLHQSAEQLFTAIIYSRTGYRPQSHHIGRLYQYARFVFPSLATLWPMAPTYIQLKHLNKAYLEARYGS